MSSLIHLLDQRRAMLIIARFSIIESLRGRLLLSLLTMSTLTLVATLFVGAITIVEQADATVSITAPLARLMAVGLISVFVVTSTSRYIETNALENVLGAPVSPITWIVGRYLGYCALALITALFASLALSLMAPLKPLLLWSASLAGELVLVCGIGLLMSISLKKGAVALLGFATFYLCARTIGVIQMLLQQPAIALESDGTTGSVLGWFIDGLALLLPRVDLMTKTDWLLSGSETTLMTVLPGLGQTVIYAVLILVVGSLDMDRRYD